MTFGFKVKFLYDPPHPIYNNQQHVWMENRVPMIIKHRTSRFLALALISAVLLAGCSRVVPATGQTGAGQAEDRALQQPAETLSGGSGNATSGEGEAAMEKVTFQTKDNVTIAGNYWKGGEKAVLLLHMMPATKESWNDFAAMLSKGGYTVLAIDMRGHGESTKKGSEELDFTKFSDAEHQTSIMDVEAAADFLKSKGARQLFVVGASIGANLALEYQSQHAEVAKSVLLSAGTNYRGIQTLPLAEKLRANQSVFLAAGEKDDDTAKAANQIGERLKGDKRVKIFTTDAHGTNLFGEYPGLMGEILDWLGR
jgi:esterase/lipase